MCGITGAVWNQPELAISPPVLARMTDALRHRGPDDSGTYQAELSFHPPYGVTPGIALGFRRLSIIDLAGGKQPLANEDGSVQLVFNGEIYNFRDLRRRLEGAGHRFRSDSDSETIVHLYEDEGLDCFQHLAGMFAIALWDQRRKRLVLARDRVGKKPLVYRCETGRLSFASELKSLLELPGAPREIDPAAVDEYLTYQYVPHPNCIFRGYRKLPPGWLAVWEDGGLKTEAYWKPQLSQERQIAPAAALETFESQFDAAVRERMQSDVPLGAFLSGGIDSTLVVAAMQRAACEPVRTFAIGFPDKAYDESGYAAAIAAHLKTEHHTLTVDPSDPSILEKLAFHYDEPFADSSAIPTYYLCQLARAQVTVALTGDGGDELFAGYPRYQAVALAGWFDRWPPLRALASVGLWQRLPTSGRQKSLLRRLKRFSEGLGMPPQRRYLEWISIFGEQRRAELYSDSFLAQLNSDPGEFLASAWNRAKGRDAVTAASLADLTTYLPCDLLTKVDLASMAHGLECRQPFLDHRLVEFSASLPVGLKYRRRVGKLLLRQALERRVPRALWDRPKMGFGAPLDAWFRGPWQALAGDRLLHGRLAESGWFRPEALATLWREHQSRQFDHSARLWALLMLDAWLRRWC